jgi:uracil-DNA glycosylase
MAEPEPFSMYSPAKTSVGKTLLLLGEAPGEEEMKANRPFVGPSGQLLDSLLAMAGLNRDMFHATNVFAARPPNNDLKLWTLTKTDLKRAGFTEHGRLPRLNNRFLHPSKEPELQRLRAELQQIKPDLILALGGTALWALAGDSRITMYRGSFFTPRLDGESGEHEVRPCSALATFHPAAVLREWSYRPIVWADMLKASRWLNGTLLPPLRRKLWINPTLDEISHVYERFARVPSELLGVDLETSPRAGQITSFAIGSSTECIVFPVWDPATLPNLCQRHDDASSEALTWRWIKRFCELPNPKVLQYGLYDLQWLLDFLDIRPVNVLHDTVCLQHSLQPELPKDLGTLGSLYLNEPSWKWMRVGKPEESKADE